MNDIKNQKLKNDINQKLSKKESELSLRILNSIEINGSINQQELSKIARELEGEEL